jgi:hypothetical protein
MKKNSFFMVFIFFATCLMAQNSAPNGGFEQWNVVTFSYPTNYDSNINKEALEEKIDFPLTKVTGYESNSAVQLITTESLGMSYMTNNKPGDEDPSQWHGGVPYTLKPTGFQGYYKYNQASGDQGLVIIAFSKNGENIGYYPFNLSGLHTDFTPFNFTFSPALTDTPDSVVVAFASSGFSGAVVGSALVIDRISFTGVADQPALLNGDFEQWTNVQIESPISWYTDNGDFKNSAMIKTSDAHSGSYAVELKTFLGEENNQPKVRSGQLMTGYYGNNCNGNCFPVGGCPFTNQSDMLEFYYKYAPIGNDNGTVDLLFKTKSGSNNGWYAHADLPASSSYSKVQVPINLSFVPDTVVIQFQSSNWSTLSTANIGSDLKIDDVVFLSQKTGVKNIHSTQTLFYPNPVQSNLSFRPETNIQEVFIYSLSGSLVLKQSIAKDNMDVSSLNKGIYLIRLKTKDGIYNEKLIKE